MARNLTRQERIEARHLLQELMENARTARNALDPVSGMLAVSDEAWQEQWQSLKLALEKFSGKVMPVPEVCPGSGRPWGSGTGNPICPSCHLGWASLKVSRPRRREGHWTGKVPAHAKREA